jgi:hypothetical protein
MKLLARDDPVTTLQRPHAEEVDTLSRGNHRRAVEAATNLLYYAVESGKVVGPEVREPILAAGAAVGDDTAAAATLESRFLEAYGKLAQLMAPVTERTLRASDKRFGQHGSGIRGLLPAQAQRRALLIAAVAITQLSLIGGIEAGRGLLATIPEMQEQLAKLETNIEAVDKPLAVVGDRLMTLASEPHDEHALMLQSELRERKSDLENSRASLAAQWTEVNSRRLSAIGWLYSTVCFGSHCPFNESAFYYLAPVILGTILGGFLLPMLYGALGTCVYILRGTYAKMTERSFDPARAGEIWVRLLLGTVGGFTLQWVCLSEANHVAGNITPGVLAFLGGYSVELPFTALDRIITTVKAAIRTDASDAKAGASMATSPAPGTASR